MPTEELFCKKSNDNQAIAKTNKEEALGIFIDFLALSGKSSQSLNNLASTSKELLEQYKKSGAGNTISIDVIKRSREEIEYALTKLKEGDFKAYNVSGIILRNISKQNISKLQISPKIPLKNLIISGYNGEKILIIKSQQQLDTTQPSNSLTIEYNGDLENFKVTHCYCLESIEVNPEIKRFTVVNNFLSLKELPSNLKNLISLDLHGCNGLVQNGKLHPSVINAIIHSSNLEEINLRSVFSMAPLAELPNLSNLKNLKKLDLGYCYGLVQDGKLHKSVIDVISQSLNLEELNLNRISALKELPKLPLKNLKKLNIGYCYGLVRDGKLHPNIIDLIKQSPNLEELSLGPLRGLIELPDLFDLTKLKKLDLHYCGELNDSKFLNVELKNLEEIDFSGCKGLTKINQDGLKENVIEFLKKCPNLKKIKINDILEMTLDEVISIFQQSQQAEQRPQQAEQRPQQGVHQPTLVGSIVARYQAGRCNIS